MVACGPDNRLSTCTREVHCIAPPEIGAMPACSSIAGAKQPVVGSEHESCRVCWRNEERVVIRCPRQPSDEPPRVRGVGTLDHAKYYAETDDDCDNGRERGKVPPQRRLSGLLLRVLGLRHATPFLR